MLTIAQLTEMLGWSSLISIVLLAVIGLALITMQPFIMSIHSRMLKIPESELPVLYFQYMAGFKLLSLMLFIVPYIALKLMGN